MLEHNEKLILSGTELDLIFGEVRISNRDRANPMPLWALVAERLRELIDNGRIPVGTQIENEVSLSERLGISRPTMRRALQDLVDRGLLVRKRGAGTQVIMRDVRRPVALTSLYEDLVKSGRSPRTKVIRFEIIPVSDTMALTLGVPPRSDMTSIQRLRFANDEPLALMNNWIPSQMVKLRREDLEIYGLYECLRKSGSILPSTANEVIGARIATPEECELLQVKRGSAVLTMTRTAWSADGLGVEYGSHIYRSDRYAFEHTVNQP